MTAQVVPQNVQPTGVPGPCEATFQEPSFCCVFNKNSWLR